MADKKQFDGSETSEKSKSLLFSLSQAKPASTAEAETSANQSLLYTLWKSVSGKFAKPAQPQEEKPAAQEPEAELFEDDHPLARLRRAWSQEQAASRGDNTDSDQAPFGPRDLLDGGELLPVHRRLIEQAARSAAEMLASFHGDGEQLQAVNGHVGVMESEDGLSAWLLLLPPLYGGGDVTLEHLYTALVERGITYGVDIQALETLAQPLYFRIVEAARGTPPVDGEDGSVEEVIPTSSSVRFVEKQNGVIDFKDMNWFHNVNAGDVLCRLIPPVPAKNGTNIHGAQLTAREGRRAVPPAGKNTVVSEDGLTLVARIEGEVVYRSGQYHVEQALTINGNVDFSTGNLDVKGAVIVMGDICEGFTVKASGDITVYGMIEGATLVSGGNIFAKTGMNGNGKGSMTARGEIRCKFIENGSADAEGNIYLESAINARLSSQSSVLVKSGRGALIGGETVAMKTIEATSAGNKNNYLTTVSIKATESFKIKQKQVEDDLRKTFEELDELTSSENGTAMTNEARLRSSTLKMKERKLRQQLEQMRAQCEELDSAVMRFGALYPNTVAVIGGAAATSKQEHTHCLIYQKDREIVFGTV